MNNDIRPEPQTPWMKDTVTRTPYAPELMCHKIVYQDETELCTEAFNPDDPTLVDRLPNKC